MCDAVAVSRRVSGCWNVLWVSECLWMEDTDDAEYKMTLGENDECDEYVDVWMKIEECT